MSKESKKVKHLTLTCDTRKSGMEKRQNSNISIVGSICEGPTTIGEYKEFNI